MSLRSNQQVEPSYTAVRLYRWIDPHVTETNLCVLRKVWKKIKKSERKRPDKKAIRKDLYRGVLQCHADALKIYRMVS